MRFIKFIRNPWRRGKVKLVFFIFSCGASIMSGELLLQELRKQESELLDQLRKLEERKTQLMNALSELKKKLDEVRDQFKRTRDIYESYKLEKDMSDLSRRMAPLENELSEVEMKIRGLQRSISETRKKIEHLEYQQRSKWVREDSGS